ncbi:hypothetical protein NP493_276g03034 [Ridgeia piscesae]|uniref:Phytanoyl-CoA hydroxylase-interacting protein-like C-terminal domain-containing protein n=1 Tax=Ridgeia piscesae TaxID=27915 RepID=A0AAD9NXE9_RIDPI|nr:hypothetical protein NP493_276g03034 [Ridgeia piscesae]
MAYSLPYDTTRRSTRAVFTPEELRTLHTMAVNHVMRTGSSDFKHCRTFYRNKLPEYFRQCKLDDNNIMKVYLKDNNGDPKSIINGQIKGLFFATSVDPITDMFCRGKLIKLNLTNNDFLKRMSGMVFVTDNVWVEVLYTEDVDLSRPDCTFSTVYSRGTSTPGGLPKNPSCTVCNLPTATARTTSDDLEALLAKLRMF